jgi:2-furoyl-CoA dehydrogenase 2Fe-2S iron sulfur subunit
MSVSHWLETDPAADEQAVREMLSGHLCRCTGYTGIVKAVMEVADDRRRLKGHRDV